MKMFINTVIIISIIAIFAHANTPVTQLTSNNVMALAGNGDTLWLATERGFNYRTNVNTQDGWSGFEIGDLRHRFWYMAFGGEGAAALVYNGNETSSDQIGFWYFNHRTGQPRERYFRFSQDLRNEDGDVPTPVGEMIYANGNFWAPFGIGGIVRYDPATNSVRAIRPNDMDDADPVNIGADTETDENIRNERVVLALADYGDGKILVTSPRALWVYDPAANDAGSKWTKLHDSQTAGFGASSSNGVFDSFAAAFTLDKKNAPKTLYCVMNMKRDAERYTSLYSFSTNENKWYRALGAEAGVAIFPAGPAALYVVENNRVRLFADTLSAGGGRDNHLKEILAHERFRAMLEDAGGELNPLIKDILFLQGSGDAGVGTLVVGTSSGIYVCGSAEPLTGEYAPFRFIHYTRGVREGDSYALPGIIRSSEDGRYDRSVFVYRLKKDGNVTIRVYDYNMSLVKTVVRGERRRAGERSTDPSRDFWDGTNQGGRRVYPGVYYYRITSNGGERFFGKVVLAR